MIYDNEILSELNSLYKYDSINALVRTCESVEIRLLDMIEESLITLFQKSSVENNQSFTTGPQGIYIYNEIPFQIKFNETSKDNSLLELSIKSIDNMKSTLDKGLKVKIDSVGRYAVVKIFVDTRLEKFKESISDIVENVFVVGYRWLKEYVRLKLNEIYKHTSEELYSFLRQILPEKIVENVWLYVIYEKQGLYIPSSINRDKLLSTVSNRNYNLDISPIQALADFSTRLMDFEKLFAKSVLGNDKTLEAKLTKAPYQDSGFQLVEQIVYKSDKLISQPLVKEGKILMTVGYPIELRKDVELILYNNRQNFANILENKHSFLKSTFNTIIKKGILKNIPPEYFEYAGRFFKGMAGIESK
ncbi:MAG: hypothetical protein IIC75_09210 [Bacteroidetes bacterium]|nr:hypothetical protein [Bacteroidota bacterium]